MDNWYKKALRDRPKRSRFEDVDTGHIIEGPNMSRLKDTRIEKMKRWLEEKHPNVNWTMEAVAEWINDNFIGNPNLLEKPQDLSRRPLDD